MGTATAIHTLIMDLFIRIGMDPVFTGITVIGRIFPIRGRTRGIGTGDKRWKSAFAVAGPKPASLIFAGA